MVWDYLLLFLLILVASTPLVLCTVGIILRKKPVGITLYFIGSFFVCCGIAALLVESWPWVYEHIFRSSVYPLFAILLPCLWYLSYRLCYIIFPGEMPKPKKVQQKEDTQLQSVTLALRTIYSTCDISFPYHDVLYYVKSNLSTPNGPDPIKYTRQDGRAFSAYPSEPLLFAYICLAQYAADDRRDDLRSFCDIHITEASRSSSPLF